MRITTSSCRSEPKGKRTAPRQLRGTRTAFDGVRTDGQIRDTMDFGQATVRDLDPMLQPQLRAAGARLKPTDEDSR